MSKLNQESRGKVRRLALYYLAGLGVSSFGSLFYIALLPALLFAAEVSTLFIGSLLGVIRITVFLVNLTLGQIGDYVSPKKVMIGCEIGAALGSLLIIWTWREFGVENLTPFFVANIVRVFFTSLQAGSVQKYAKEFDDKLELNGAMAFRMSGVTNGVLMVAGLIGVVFFERLNIEFIVWIDFLSFLINGVLILALQPTTMKKEGSFQPSMGLNFNVKSYYRLFPLLAVLDVILSVAIFGANTLNVRLLPLRTDLVPLMPALFGAAAVLISFLSHWKVSPQSRILWLAFGVSLLSQGLFQDWPFLVVAAAFFRNCCYWLIYNGIGRALMSEAPQERYATLASGRNALVVGILATGEFWVGLTTQIPIKFEMAWRAALTLVPGLWKLNRNTK